MVHGKCHAVSGEVSGEEAWSRNITISGICFPVEILPVAMASPRMPVLWERGLLLPLSQAMVQWPLARLTSATVSREEMASNGILHYMALTGSALRAVQCIISFLTMEY